MSQIEKTPSSVGAVGRRRGRRFGWVATVFVVVAALAGWLGYPAPAAERADGEAAPDFVDKIPEGFRDWKLISVAHEEGNLKSFAAILGNDVAIRAFRDGTLPFPDGAIIAAVHWKHVPSEENNKVFGQAQSCVAGSPTNVQFMVKVAKKYGATGGWGFGHFNGRDSKPAEAATMKSCFECHQKIKERDQVYTRYAP
jgi:hypothetical protein